MMMKRFVKGLVSEKPARGVFYWKMLTAYLLLLFVPVIFMETVNFTSVKKSTLESLQHVFDREGTKQLDFLEEQLNVLQKVTFNSRLTSYFYGPFEEHNYPGAVLDISKYLNDQSPWLTFYSGICYYNMEKGIAVTAGGTIDETHFMKNYLQFYRPVSLKEDKLVFAEARNHQLKEDQLVMITPLERGVSCLIFTVNKDMLGNMLTIPNGTHDGAVDLYYGDQLIYSSNRSSEHGSGAEKAQTSFFRDKEKQFTVTSSSFKLDWHFPESVYTEAIFQSIWKQFVVVFLVIAIGGYMIYQFMERNYKPLKKIIRNLADKMPNQGNEETPRDEVKYLDMVLGELLYSKQFLEESNLELKREQLLYQLLCSHIENGSILYEECLKCGIRVDGRSFLCLYLEESRDMEGEAGYEYLTERLPSENPSIYVYSAYYTETSFLFLITSDLECEEFEKVMRQKVPFFSQSRFGRVVDRVDQICDSYCSLQTDHTAKKEPDHDFYPKTSMAVLRDAVEGEQLAKMGLAVQSIREAMERASVPVAIMIYLEACEIIAGESQAISPLFEMVQTKEDCQTILSNQLTLLYKKFRMESVMTTSDQIQKEDSAGNWKRDICEIRDYIEAHCMEKTFSIKAMAAEIGTTPSNLSHYFKKCTGQNISKYIDSVRMKRALELLNGSMRIVDVAEELGYNSTSVFIETFKRVCGITPSQYRQEKNQKQDI